MAWIKRNFYFVVGGGVALLLLGAAGYYNYVSWSRNEANLAKLSDIHDTIVKISKSDELNPGNATVDRKAQAVEQNAQLQAWMAKARAYFRPIPAIPPPGRAPLTSEQFANALHQTITSLQRQATNANVALPPDPSGGYTFSFKAESQLAQFSSAGLNDLAVQLGEVKTLSELLFAAGINELDGIQRVRASDDDAGGPQADYTTLQVVNNPQAVIAPYAVTISSFGPEIARVISNLATSTNGMVIKSINVQPASPTPYTLTDANSPSPTVRQGDLLTVLKEHLLRVTMEIDIIKLKS
jgi:hypothetical protein